MYKNTVKVGIHDGTSPCNKSQRPTLVPATSPTNSNQFEYLGQVPVTVHFLYSWGRILILSFDFFPVCLRVQSNPANMSDFKGISPERAFADFIFASVILHLVVMNFIGWSGHNCRIFFNGQKNITEQFFVMISTSLNLEDHWNVTN